MEEGDSETNYAYYAFHKLQIMPRAYDSIDIYEKAVVMAFIDIKIEEKKREAARAKK